MKNRLSLTPTSRPSYAFIEALVHRLLADFPGVGISAINAYEKQTYAVRERAQGIGEAVIKGAAASFPSVGFVVRKNARKTGWRLRFVGVHAMTGVRQAV